MKGCSDMSKKEKAPKKPKKVKEPPRPERTESGGLDYSVYYMKPAEKLGYILLAAAGLFALGYIFYRSAILAGLLAGVTYGLEQGREYLYQKEMTLKFIMGTESLDNYDEYVENLKRMGVERAVEIQQAAYDRYINR